MDSLPSSFGKARGVQKKDESEERVAKTRRLEVHVEAPAPPAAISYNSVGVGTDDHPDDDDAHSVGEDEDVDQSDGDDLAEELPVTHEVVLKDHSKTVSAFSVDPSGARIVTGSYDYDCKLWDFGGMDATFRPFRSWEPCGNYQIHDVAFSNAGDSFLVISGTSQPKLYNRDAQEIAEFTKGDMYIRDLRNTAGHVAELTSCAWHPKNANVFITSSADSSVRIWDVNERFKSKQVIVVKSKERGTRTKITSCAYSHDGRLIGGTGLDGTLHLWPTNGNYARPSQSIEGAHVKGKVTSSLIFSLDTHSLVTRGGDDTVKFWDIRSFRKPVSVAAGLPTLNQETNVTFSPDERFVLTGTAGSKAAVVPGRPDLDEIGPSGNGKVVVMKRDTLEIVQTLGVSEGSVVRVLWHPRINQIFASTSLGAVHVLYSPELSQKGATMAAARLTRRPREEDSTALPDPSAIVTPNALPMFRDDTVMGRSTKRKRERERNDPVKTQKPLPPVKGPGRGGRVGASATQHVVQGLVHDTLRDEDPREALLKYANREGDHKWTGAWSKTQPKTIFSNETDDEGGGKT